LNFGRGVVLIPYVVPYVIAASSKAMDAGSILAFDIYTSHSSAMFRVAASLRGSPVFAPAKTYEG
jgi:hypothetical protein